MQDTTDEKIKNYKCLSKSYLKQNGGCGTTAGWKTSPYVHLLLGGKPRSSCTPHSMTSRARSENKLNLCSFGLNVFPFITKLYLPTIKKQTKHFWSSCTSFALSLPILHSPWFWTSCGCCNESDPLFGYHINSWGETKSCHLVFI